MAVSDESVLSWEADSGAMKAKSGRILERSVGQLVSSLCTHGSSGFHGKM